MTKCDWCQRKAKTPTEIRNFFWCGKFWNFCDRHFLYIQKNSNHTIKPSIS